MIYCVIPPELADELYDKMVEYYKDNPNVTVIIDRRKGPDRRNRKGGDDAKVRGAAGNPRPAPRQDPRHLPRDRGLL